MNHPRLLRSSTSAVLALTRVAVGDDGPDPALVPTGTSDLPDTWGDLTRAVVTLEADLVPDPVVAPGAEVTAVTLSSVLPTALQTVPVPAPSIDAPDPAGLPRLDLSEHSRAVGELGDGGDLVRGTVAGEDVTLYVKGDAARVVSTGPSWEASPGDVHRLLAATDLPAAGTGAVPATSECVSRMGSSCRPRPVCGDVG